MDTRPLNVADRARPRWFMGRLGLNWPRIATLAGAAGAFTWICLSVWDFTVDDAYVIYRYAANLATGHGLVWNPGENPVEGFTSLLWVLVHAATHGVGGLSPATASKWIALASVFACLGLLVRYSDGLPISMTWIFCAALVLNPALAYLTVQGLETSLAALTLMVFSLAILTRQRVEGGAGSLAASGLAFVAFLVRPDSLVFTGPVLVGSYVLRWKQAGRGARWAALRAFGLLGLALVVYNLWRWLYFGYPLPNTAYLKQASGPFLKPEGVQSVVSFGERYVVPYLLLTVVFSVWARDRLEGAVEALPVLIGVLVFAAYNLTVEPIQGEFWRFLMPAFPSFLVALIFTLRTADPPVGAPTVQAALLVTLLGLSAWNLRLWGAIENMAEQKNVRDRAAVGRALSGMDGVMLTTEAGALPYYSGWRAVDIPGLASEVVVHEGVSSEFLDELNPDLVVLFHQGAFSDDRRYYPVIIDYLRDAGFRAVGLTVKVDDKYHYHFVRRDSPLYDELVCRLSQVEGLDQGSINELVPWPELRLMQAASLRC